MRVLLVGGGGREHALAWKIAQSPLLKKLYCAPGNAGIASLAECVDIEAGSIEKLKEFAINNSIDLTVVGPEVPLVAGIGDLFRESGLLLFGPGKDGSRLEGSKVWAKEKMKEWSIPTAPYAVFDSFDHARYHLNQFYGDAVVIKADGLAAGKGVIVASGPAEAEEALYDIMVERNFGDAGKKVVIEQCLKGEELSVMAICDGKKLVVLPSAQDHKAIGEGDEGPNTGGMGAYSPAPLLTEELLNKVKNSVFEPLMNGFASEKIDFRGIIYAGLMVDNNEVNVLEFNVRFGDPETQAIIPRIDSDLLPLLYSAAKGKLDSVNLNISDNHAVCVVMASGGYPGEYRKGYMIDGLERLENEKNVAVFHAGTEVSDDHTVTAGGRVLGVTSWDATLKGALEHVYAATDKIYFKNSFFRKDIAYKAMKFYKER